MNQQTAIREVEKAIQLYGRPHWLGYVANSTRRVAGAEAINALLEGDSVPSKPQKRADKYKTIERWTKEHLFEAVTVPQIASIGDVSNATARKFINDRVDLFRKIGGRVWEIRDPVSDRRHSKA